eukprot:gene6602-9412_t
MSAWAPAVLGRGGEWTAAQPHIQCATNALHAGADAGAGVDAPLLLETQLAESMSWAEEQGWAGLRAGGDCNCNLVGAISLVYPAASAVVRLLLVYCRWFAGMGWRVAVMCCLEEDARMSSI